MKSDAMIRREKLEQIHASGSTEGINKNSLKRFQAKGYLNADGSLTNFGLSVMKGKIGAAGRGASDFDTANRAASKAGGHNTARGRAARAVSLAGEGIARAKMSREELEYRRQQDQAEQDQAEQKKANEKKQYGKILPAHALKISLSDGGPITRDHLSDLIADGWQVHPASTAPGKVGRTLPGSEILAWNPEVLGETGKARAVIIWSHSPVDHATVEGFRAAGWDVSAAPKHYRETPAPIKNPQKQPTIKQQEKYAQEAWDKANDKSKSWEYRLTWETIANQLENTIEARRTGKPKAPTFKNPSHAATLARRKAAAFFGRNDLITEPRALKGYTPPEAFVETGDFIALEYDSHKFDGKKRIYRHEATKQRKLYISTDGSTLIIDPPLKVTKRGIEG